MRVRPLDGSEPHDIIVKEGEMFMLPRYVATPSAAPGRATVGLIMEFPRGFDAEGNPQKDALRWYCPACDAPVYEAQWILRKIDEDLKIIMEQFWDGPAERRTCRSCGTVIERGTAIRTRRPGRGRGQPRAEAQSSKFETRTKSEARKQGRSS